MLDVIKFAVGREALLILIAVYNFIPLASTTSGYSRGQVRDMLVITPALP